VLRWKKLPECGFEQAERDQASREERCRQKNRLLGRPKAKLPQGRRDETFIKI